MPEQQPIDRGGEIRLPSALRIRQRLGQVSTSRAFKRGFVPQMEKLAHAELPGDIFLSVLSARLVGYALYNSMEPEAYERRTLPRVVKQLVPDEVHQRNLIARFIDGLKVRDNNLAEPAKVDQAGFPDSQQVFADPARQELSVVESLTPPGSLAGGFEVSLSSRPG